MESTHIRAHGDRAYWDDVALLARLQKTSLGAFVKDAVDKLHGDDLAKVRQVSPLFLPDDVANTQQKDMSEAAHANS